MSSRYNRSNFIDTTIESGTKEYDFLEQTFSKFQFKRKSLNYRISSEDINPRLISSKVYGTTDYWWVILAYNNIIDVYNELTPGKLIKIPDIKDIEELYTFNKQVVEKA